MDFVLFAVNPLTRSTSLLTTIMCRVKCVVFSTVLVTPHLDS